MKLQDLKDNDIFMLSGEKYLKDNYLTGDDFQDFYITLVNQRTGCYRQFNRYLEIKKSITKPNTYVESKSAK